MCWNSQGDKADQMWSTLLTMGNPQLRPASRWPGSSILPGVPGPTADFPANATTKDDLLVFVSEGSTPPWINPKAKVSLGHAYTFQAGSAGAGTGWINKTPSRGGIAQALAAWGGKGRRVADALWVPWQNEPGKPSLRCSTSLYWFPGSESTLTLQPGVRALVEDSRPLLTATLLIGGNLQATILFAHLPANHYKAGVVLPELAKQAEQVVMQSVPLMVAGDLNFNLQIKNALNAVPAGWGVLRTNAPTQNSGGELDWAMVKGISAMNPTRVWSQTIPTDVPPKMGFSDHAALLYQL